MSDSKEDYIDKIAVIGMDCRFPGADNVEEFWTNLANGVDSISSFSEEELRDSGVAEFTFKKDNFVNAKGIIEGVDLFDAEFFEMSPMEAVMLDPQQRVFLECAWKALESAGYNGDKYKGRISVYAGVDANTYMVNNLYSNKEALSNNGDMQFIMSDKDYLSTRVSYKLNLRGPSFTVQSACSSSMVSLHLASESLLSEESDIALIGGVSITFPLKSGFLHEDGGIISPEGRCKPFDKEANGTIYGNGVGVLVLKRLEDAVNDGDTIHAVICGTAVDNDGSLKVGYTAPSVSGQCAVINEALSISGVEADTIGYIETHGTGTKLGDSIEFEALNRVYKKLTTRKNFCALGSVKSNIGHLSTAAGVASLIKTIMCLKKKKIPPTLHYQSPNPSMDFANSPFFINTELIDWHEDKHPRRAGVSCFGLGGTNVHVILEEAPKIERAEPDKEYNIVPISAKSEQALDCAVANLLAYSKENKGTPLADISYTLQEGRKDFAYRKSLVCKSTAELISILEENKEIVANYHQEVRSNVAFMFSGYGSQYINMTLDLYKGNKRFKRTIDECINIINEITKEDYKNYLYLEDYQEEYKTEKADIFKQLFAFPEDNENEKKLRKPSVLYPLLFTVEYALANELLELNVIPSAMIGHSIGEYVAAAIAGVLSTKDALYIVYNRGKLIEELPKGAMLSVNLGYDKIQQYLSDTISLAAINSFNICGVSGDYNSIEQLEKTLIKNNIACKRVETEYAFHSYMMDKVVDKFTEVIAKVKLNKPKIPYISNVTGDWITDEVTEPSYWIKHFRQPVQFFAGIKNMFKDKKYILVEIGPGNSLSSFALQSLGDKDLFNYTIETVRNKNLNIDDSKFFLQAVGKLWTLGIEINWAEIRNNQNVRRISLPTYPFQKTSFFIYKNEKTAEDFTKKSEDIKDYLYYKSWEQAILPKVIKLAEKQYWIIFKEASKVSYDLLNELKKMDQEVITISEGKKFSKVNDKEFIIQGAQVEDYLNIFNEIGSQDTKLINVIDINNEGERVLCLLKALEIIKYPGQLNLTSITQDCFDLCGNEEVKVSGYLIDLTEVINSEFNNINFRLIDVSEQDKSKNLSNSIISSLIHHKSSVTALRNNKCYLRKINKYPNTEKDLVVNTRFKEKGKYIFINALSTGNMSIPRYLGKQLNCNLIFLEEENFKLSDELKDLEGLGIDIRINSIKEYANYSGAKGIICFYEEAVEDKKLIDLDFKELDKKIEANLKEIKLINEIALKNNLEFCMLILPMSFAIGCAGSGEKVIENAAFARVIEELNKENEVAWYIVNCQSKKEDDFSYLQVDTEKQVLLVEKILQLCSGQVFVSPTRLNNFHKINNKDKKENIILYDRPKLNTEYVEGRNEIDEVVIKIWEQVLGINKIGIRDNFFVLGGNSLLALQILFQINKVYKVQVKMAKFLEKPTIEYLSDYISLVQWMSVKEEEREEEIKKEKITSFEI